MSANGFQSALGNVLNVVGALDSLRTPGGLGRYFLAQNAALADPAIRSAIENSPFRAGTLGLGGTTLPPVSPDPTRRTLAERRLAAAGHGGGGFFANLPTETPEGQLKSLQTNSLLSLAQSNPSLFRAISGSGSIDDVQNAYNQLHTAVPIADVTVGGPAYRL